MRFGSRGPRKLLRPIYVALQLCPPLQFGPLTYQQIKCVFFFFQSKCVVIVSSPFDFPTRGGLQCEFCSFRFADPLEDLCMKQFRWVFGEFTEVRSMFETFLAEGICSYVGELESMGQE